MVKRLYINKKIEVRKSLIHGYGVFAKGNIKKDELIEECFYIVQPSINPYNADYLFKWQEKGNFKFNVLPLGFGCIYNSSKILNENNAKWETDEKNNIFIFTSVKLIKKDEEILTYYGDKWWKNYNQKYLPKNIE